MTDPYTWPDPATWVDVVERLKANRELEYRAQCTSARSRFFTFPAAAQ